MKEQPRGVMTPFPLAQAGRPRTFKCPCECGSIGFCPTHLARLHVIRDGMVGKGQFHQTVAKRGYRPPICCIPDCDERRARGEKFCAEHADLGED